MTCVCVLRKSLLHKFLKEKGSHGCESTVGVSVAAVVEAEEAADARKRQKQSQ